MYPRTQFATKALRKTKIRLGIEELSNMLKSQYQTATMRTVLLFSLMMGNMTGLLTLMSALASQVTNPMFFIHSCFLEMS